MIKKYHKLANSKCNILVIGDVMVDEYYSGSVNRISPESPVPVFNYKENYYRAGGAANVAANIAALKGKVSLMAIIGRDEYGNILKDILQDLNINHKWVITDQNKITTVKTRLLAQNYQQMIRIDREDNKEISIDLQEMLLEELKANINQFDIILVSDYLKGFLTEEFLQRVIQICNQSNKKVIIDIKGGNLKKYKGAYLLKPNKKELSDILKFKILKDDEIIGAAKQLKREANTKAVLVTCGEKGMVLIDEKDEEMQISAIAKEVFDVTGAGDTVLSYLGFSIANKLSLNESAQVANVAAGIKVGKVGTSIVRLDEVAEYYYRTSEKSVKIISIDEYLKIKLNYQNKKVVFTNGCFDILHIGHIRYLKKAAELGDKLIVGVNSDNSIKRIKGEKRPIISEKDRIEMLASLVFIDHIIKFEENTPYELIKIIQPDVLVKGSDYKPEEVVGKEIVERNGGKVVLMPLEEDFSTTSIIEKILLTYGKKGGVYGKGNY